MGTLRMMYAVLCYASEEVVGAWSKEEDEVVMERLEAVQAKLASQGRFGMSARLLPTTAATTVRKGREPFVIDGPFAETKEQLLGFYLIDCAGLDDAVETAKELAIANGAPGAYELRPVGYLNRGDGAQ